MTIEESPWVREKDVRGTSLCVRDLTLPNYYHSTSLSAGNSVPESFKGKKPDCVARFLNQLEDIINTSCYISQGSSLFTSEMGGIRML